MRNSIQMVFAEIQFVYVEFVIFFVREICVVCVHAQKRKEKKTYRHFHIILFFLCRLTKRHRITIET